MSYSSIALFVTAMFVSAYGAYEYSNSKWETRWALRDSTDAIAQAAAEKHMREIENNWNAKLEDVNSNAEIQLEIARADADIANNAANSLHNTIDELQQRLLNSEASNNPTASCQRQTNAVRVLSGLLKSTDDLAGKFAREADEARQRGLTCEAAYNALTSSLP